MLGNQHFRGAIIKLIPGENTKKLDARQADCVYCGIFTWQLSATRRDRMYHL